MKANRIALIFGCVLTFVVGSFATTQAFIITLNPENTMILDPTNDMVLHPFVGSPGEELGQAVLMLTYEPGGLRHLFNLSRITVRRGSLSVGIRYEDGTIGVFNDLTPGSWDLGGANRIDRITLECPSTASCPSIETLHFAFHVQSLEIAPLTDPVVVAYECTRPLGGRGSCKCKGASDCLEMGNDGVCDPRGSRTCSGDECTCVWKRQ